MIMTEKRFTLHINWFNKEKTEGEALLKDNGQPLLLTESISDARLLKNILNELSEENEELRLQLNLCSAQRNEFHRAARENANRVGKLKKENEQLKQKNEWLKSEIQKLYNFVKIDVDHNIEVYPKSLMEHILEILKLIGDVE